VLIPTSHDHRMTVMTLHLTALDHEPMGDGRVLYLIRVNGRLGPSLLMAFPGLVPRREGTETVLTGLLDTAALFGVLAEIEALGLDLLEVRKVPPPGHQAQGHQDPGCA
jgi:hypothetical protein